MHPASVSWEAQLWDPRGYQAGSRDGPSRHGDMRVRPGLATVVALHEGHRLSSCPAVSWCTVLPSFSEHACGRGWQRSVCHPTLLGMCEAGLASQPCSVPKGKQGKCGDRDCEWGPRLGRHSRDFHAHPRGGLAAPCTAPGPTVTALPSELTLRDTGSVCPRSGTCCLSTARSAPHVTGPGGQHELPGTS